MSAKFTQRAIVGSAAVRFRREALVRILASPDYAEGLAAFAERRAPKFADS